MHICKQNVAFVCGICKQYFLVSLLEYSCHAFLNKCVKFIYKSLVIRRFASIKYKHEQCAKLLNHDSELANREAARNYSSSLK